MCMGGGGHSIEQPAQMYTTPSPLQPSAPPPSHSTHTYTQLQTPTHHPHIPHAHPRPHNLPPSTPSPPPPPATPPHPNSTIPPTHTHPPPPIRTPPHYTNRQLENQRANLPRAQAGKIPRGKLDKRLWRGVVIECLFDHLAKIIGIEGNKGSDPTNLA